LKLTLGQGPLPAAPKNEKKKRRLKKRCARVFFPEKRKETGERGETQKIYFPNFNSKKIFACQKRTDMVK
jgi:hypothetical protein